MVKAVDKSLVKKVQEGFQVTNPKDFCFGFTNGYEAGFSSDPELTEEIKETLMNNGKEYLIGFRNGAIEAAKALHALIDECEQYVAALGQD